MANQKKGVGGAIVCHDQGTAYSRFLKWEEGWGWSFKNWEKKCQGCWIIVNYRVSPEK